MYGEPFTVPRDIGREAMEKRRAELETKMCELTDRADSHWGP